MFRHQNHYSLAFWKIRIQTIFLFYVLVLNRTTWLAGWREKPPSAQFLVGQTDLTWLSTGNLLIPEGLFSRLLIYSNTSVVVFIQNILPANHPMSAYHIWEIQAVYHRFDGMFDWKRGWYGIHVFDWKRSCFCKSELKMAFAAIQRRNSWTSDLNMQEMQA